MYRKAPRRRQPGYRACIVAFIVARSMHPPRSSLEIDSATFSPDLSTPRKIFSAIVRRPVREVEKSKRKNIGGREGRATLWSGPETIGDESSNGIEGGPTIHFSSKRGAREGEGKFLFNSIKLFLCRARRCSNGPVYLLAYRDGRKESIKSKLGRDGGGFARDFVTSGRCFIDLNPLTGGTLRGYSPIVFTARDALEISSRPLPPRGEGSTYLRGFMSLPLVVKVS